MARREDIEDLRYRQEQERRRRAAAQAAANFAAHQAQQQAWMGGQGGALPQSTVGGTPLERSQAWQKALGIPQYPKFKQTTMPQSIAGGGWDLIRRGAEITGRSSPWLQPVLQSRLPQGAAPAALPQYGGSYGGGYTPRGYSGGGGGGGGWGGSYPSAPAQNPLWWDPGLYNWRYGVSY